MESSVGSESNKPWDHAWDTEEIRNNRRNWSLAGDSGLLKHLQEFSENLTKKANETQDVINSMASQINETTILVDNIMNTSLALANTQFIESRVQEDNIEIEQPTEDVTKIEDDCEFSATDLLFSVCESIKQGLSIMDEKYEKVEVTASDTEDDDDNAIASVILRPKDPYRDRPLPYVFGSEQWNASNKVGLESSSSESELSDDNEDSISDIEEKNVENILSSNNHSNSGINRLSSTSSESNEFNIEENNISNKDTDNQFHARRQETLNSDTEPTTPSSVLPKIQNINNAPPSFAEELAKRLGNVLPSQKNTIVQDINEQVINCSKDDIFTSVNDADVFNNKSDNLFSEGKNLFVDEVSSSIKNLPVRAINKNIIPPSIDVPPPLSIISSAPKSTIDDLFGDVEDSDDSDDIFSKKVSKDIYSGDNETIRSEVISKQKNLNTENTQNISNITTSTPEINDKAKDLFEEQKQDDLFKIDTKKMQSPNIASIDPIKKPIGGVSILGKIDIHSSNKFLRRPSSTSSSESDFIDHPINSNSAEVAISKNNNNTDGINVFPSFQAGKNTGNSRNMFSENNTSSTSSIPTHQTSIDNMDGSSTGSDFQPLITSSHFNTQDIKREYVVNDNLFSNKSKPNSTSDQQNHQQQLQTENVTTYDEIFGPPPLSKVINYSKPKSKVTSLFDDSESEDDLFISASPDTKSLKSIDRTPSKTQTEKKKSLFDNDDNLFGSKDEPDVDLFAVTPVKSLSQVPDKLFDDNDKPVIDSALFDEDTSQFTKTKTNTDSDLFGEISNTEKVLKYSMNSLFNESLENDSKTSCDNLFEKDLATGGNNLFEKNSKGIDLIDSENQATKQSVNNLFEEPTKVNKVSEIKGSNILFKDSEDFLNSDLFSNIPTQKSTISDKISNVFNNSKNIFGGDSDSDLFATTSNSALKTNIGQYSSANLFDDHKSSIDFFSNKDSKKIQQNIINKSPESIFENTSKILKIKKLTTSIFDDSDEDDRDLFSSLNFPKKINSKEGLNIFEQKTGTKANENMEENKINEADSTYKKINESGSMLESNDKKEKVSVISKSMTKNLEKIKLFDDNDNDDDDLFGTKKNTSIKSNENKSESEITEKKEVKEVNPEIEAKLNIDDVSKHTVLDSSSKKAIFTEIKQKLEKHKHESSEKNIESEFSAVDGAVSSKKEPPKTLKIEGTTLTSDELSANQQDLKKTVMSGKIKNLMGKMNDLKILSPTDTPPLLRKKNDDKGNDNDPQVATDLESSEGSSPNFPSSESSQYTSDLNSRTKESSSPKSDNTELAISFDEPAQIETLASITSKSRVRIQSKRRPQSRYARQTALRHSGIDFDITDTTSNSTSSDQLISDSDPNSITERYIFKGCFDGEKTNPHDSGHVDDKSDLSISRNTVTNLFSPSTDEEDLFDVPPDLPEDSATKEDSLFGRAPILSPVANLQTGKFTDIENSLHRSLANQTEKEVKNNNNNKEEKIESTDPLRDESHDPLEDPSQLFAFVTKTPSPDKNKGILLKKEDDSLFSNSSKLLDKAADPKSKSALDLFVDDDDTSGSDLFSSNKNKIKKKIKKEKKTDLLDGAISEDDDNDLFKYIKKSSDTTKIESKLSTSSGTVKKNENTFLKSNKTKNIFDNSSDDEDIFTSIKKPMKKKTQSIFEDHGDNFDDNIFGNPTSSSAIDKQPLVESEKVMAKKSVTKDLKKTAKKIVEDPLSVLRND